MRRLLIVGLFISGVSMLTAQTSDEALRFAQTRFGGTARGMGVAGAFGAIGADYTSVVTNPGGLGLFRKIEITITPGIDHVKTTTNYEGFSNTDHKLNVNLANIGIVIAAFRKREPKTALKGLNFGIGYNRLATFQAERYYRNETTGNSILKGYREELDGISSTEIGPGGAYGFEPYLAYFAYLLDPIAPDSQSYSSVTDGRMVDQRITLNSSGSASELSFSMAANYKNKLYFGAYIGIPFISYKERYNFKEATDTSDHYFDQFSLDQNLDISGVGINFKMGFIYTPAKWFRVGAALHTPTYYSITRSFWSDITAKFDSVNTPYEVESPIGRFEYNQTTPMRVVGSLGFIFNKYGFFSFDYEWVDYSQSSFIMDSDYRDFENSINSSIDNRYGTAHAFRAGIEIAFDEFTKPRQIGPRIRGGVAHYTSPINDASFTWSGEGASNYYTFGAGVRLEKVFFDFAYVRKEANEVNLVVNDIPAKDKTVINSFLLTTGFRF